MQILKAPQGEFQLIRYPSRKKEPLRAWDAADEYLLNRFYEECSANKKSSILIINDSFGALSLALSEYQVTVWTDSCLAQKAISENLKINRISVENIKIINSMQNPQGSFDYVVIKIPKSHALLEDQLYRVSPFVDADTQIIGAAMAKNIHTSTLKLFEKIIGPTKTSLAKKKARLIYCTADENIKTEISPYPKSYMLEGTRYKIVNHANVFSRESLDIGTRFFLQHLPISENYKTIVDLGCGNGIVGIIAAEKNPQAELIFLDESYMAVASAKENFQFAFADTRKAHFQVNDCLTGIAEDSADLILNNPPFHQQHAVGDEIAWQMFKQSKQVLKDKGELWVIGNRHLNYHIKLKKLFGNCETIASNKKFVILKSVKI